MNIEELREYATKLENEIKELKEANEVLELHKEKQVKDNESLINEVKELKIKNYELFTQIPRDVEKPQPVDNKENTFLSITDLTNQIIRGE